MEQDDGTDTLNGLDRLVSHATDKIRSAWDHPLVRVTTMELLVVINGTLPKSRTVLSTTGGG